MALREPPRGILLVHGGVDSAVSWAESGVAPLAVVPEDGRWTAVLPAGETTAVRRPYDDVVTMLLNPAFRLFSAAYAITFPLILIALVALY